MLWIASPRARVSIALMAFSGLRPQTLGNYDGSDGLRLGDLSEADISPDGIEFKKLQENYGVRIIVAKGAPVRRGFGAWSKAHPFHDKSPLNLMERLSKEVKRRLKDFSSLRPLPYFPYRCHNPFRHASKWLEA
ncbi:MAG: hypothetical protein QXI39_05165 [Candidatus Bathyarchaeia archaeon]